MLGDLHEVVVVGVGHVELTRRELRIVGQVNTYNIIMSHYIQYMPY